jgi:hypothetical protein
VLPIFADASGSTPVFAVRYAPKNPHPFGVTTSLRPLSFMQEKGCLGCHALGGQGGSMGPALDYDSLVPRLQMRLGTAAYRARLRAIDSLPGEPFNSYRDERTRIATLRGPALLHYWVRYHIQEPRFDIVNSTMPNLGVTDEEAAALAEFLLTPPPAKPAPEPSGPIARLDRALPKPRTWPRTWLIALAFAAGTAVGGVGVLRWRRGRGRN